MKALIRVTLALAAVALAQTVSAADASSAPSSAGVAAHRAAVAKKQALMGHAAGAQAGAGVAAVQSTTGGPRVANPYRAYPPSCGSYPLPDTPSGGLIQSVTVPLYTRDSGGFAGDPENATITIWRIACSSSGFESPYNFDGGPNSMLLMRIDRSSPDQDVVPTMPLLTSGQTTSGGTTSAYIRAAQEPNTVVSELPFDASIFAPSTVLVLENYNSPSTLGLTYFDYQFNLTIDPVLDDSCTGCATIGVPNYEPNAQTYPAAFQDLPIDGYMSSAWYDPAHSGEGIMVQVYNNPGDATRTLFAAWYTYDANGIPFWLAAQGTAAVGSNTFSNVPVYYYTGGGFAGDFNSVTQHAWGTMNFSFPNCSQMDFDFSGAASDVAGGPAGQGSRSFKKIADINGLNCE
ncbi:MAG: hypothetical protein ABW186_17660 [Rhodanobacteraceae bacterium]